MAEKGVYAQGAFSSCSVTVTVASGHIRVMFHGTNYIFKLTNGSGKVLSMCCSASAHDSLHSKWLSVAHCPTPLSESRCPSMLQHLGTHTHVVHCMQLTFYAAGYTDYASLLSLSVGWARRVVVSLAELYIQRLTSNSSSSPCVNITNLLTPALSHYVRESCSRNEDLHRPTRSCVSLFSS